MRDHSRDGRNTREAEGRRHGEDTDPGVTFYFSMTVPLSSLVLFPGQSLKTWPLMPLHAGNVPSLEMKWCLLHYDTIPFFSHASSHGGFSFLFSEPHTFHLTSDMSPPTSSPALRLLSPPCPGSDIQEQSCWLWMFLPHVPSFLAHFSLFHDRFSQHLEGTAFNEALVSIITHWICVFVSFPMEFTGLMVIVRVST